MLHFDLNILYNCKQHLDQNNNIYIRYVSIFRKVLMIAKRTTEQIVVSFADEGINLVKIGVSMICKFVIIDTINTLINMILNFDK